MDNKKVGSFIASLRKEKLLTQQELADMLSVTNKAVSKWETGQGYPEITLIPVLAEILGVSTSELLKGELNKRESNDKDIASIIINETAQYHDRLIAKKSHFILFIIFIASILSAFICLLCNYLIKHTFDWSLYPMGALIMLWSIIIPIFKFKRYKILSSLLGFSVTLIPYLFLIEFLVPAKGWVIPLALPIAILCIIVIGIILFIFFHTKINIFYSFAVTVLLFGVVVNVVINKLIASFLKCPGTNDISVFMTLIISVFLAVVLIVFGYIRKKIN